MDPAQVYTIQTPALLAYSGSKAPSGRGECREGILLKNRHSARVVDDTRSERSVVQATKKARGTPLHARQCQQPPLFNLVWLVFALSISQTVGGLA